MYFFFLKSVCLVGRWLQRWAPAIYKWAENPSLNGLVNLLRLSTFLRILDLRLRLFLAEELSFWHRNLIKKFERWLTWLFVFMVSTCVSGWLLYYIPETDMVH